MNSPFLGDLQSLKQVINPTSTRKKTKKVTTKKQKIKKSSKSENPKIIRKIIKTIKIKDLNENLDS